MAIPVRIVGLPQSWQSFDPDGQLTCDYAEDRAFAVGAVGQ